MNIQPSYSAQISKNINNFVQPKLTTLGNFFEGCGDAAKKVMKQLNNATTLNRVSDGINQPKEVGKNGMSNLSVPSSGIPVLSTIYVVRMLSNAFKKENAKEPQMAPTKEVKTNIDHELQTDRSEGKLDYVLQDVEIEKADIQFQPYDVPESKPRELIKKSPDQKNIS
ncbi:MAG TPA: hypothetical protein VGP47_04765 [Parachlamydiaceae bacterium]|nr:hypothetical protein [Parachlamydiaceae bacterium]